MADDGKDAVVINERVRVVEGANNSTDRRLVRIEVLIEQQTELLTEVRDRLEGARGGGPPP
jgi:hypothetical protein